MASFAEHEQRIINRLAATDPQMSTALGTPQRKIIEAVASELATYDDEVTSTTTLYSLEAVSGVDLDYLVGQFGFTRQEARAARGTIQITRDNGDSEIEIPYGSMFYKPATTLTPAVNFTTTAYQRMDEGVLTAEIPVVCVETGTAGNVAADTVTRSSGYASFVFVNNDEPMTGGRDAETDEQLRLRFSETVFRNMASTKDQYLGLARAHADISRAVLIGQEVRYTETVQATLEGDELVASVSDERYNLDVDHVIDTVNRFWLTLADTDERIPRGSYVVDGSGKKVRFMKLQTAEVVGPIVENAEIPLAHVHSKLISVKSMATGIDVAGDQYEFDEASGVLTCSEQLTGTASDSWEVTYEYVPYDEGTFVTIEFDYFSKHNRDNTKSVELFVDGRSYERVDDIQYVDFDKVITEQNASTWVRNNGTPPSVNSLYIPLSYCPVLESTGTINVGVSTILREGTHFEFLYDNRNQRGSSRSLDAVELVGQKVSLSGDSVFQFTKDPSISVPDKCPMNVPYYYNKVVAEVQSLIDDQSVVCSDTWVHEGHRRFFGFYLAIAFSRFPRQDVIDAAEQAVIDWCNQLSFGAAIQISDVETVVANIFGIDNVRIAKQSDVVEGAPYGIWEYQRDGETTVRSNIYEDILLAEDEIAIPQFVKFISRTQKGWNG